MVELFFLLSGYFMLPYAKSKTCCEEGFFVFWWKKYKRFLPLLMITGALAAIVLKWVTAIKGVPYEYDVWVILAGMLGIGQWFSTSAVTNNPTWYISVLLVCFAFFYGVTYVAKKIKVHICVVYLIMLFYGIIMRHICITYRFSMPLFSEYIGRGIICFFAGLILGYVFDKYAPHRSRVVIGISLVYLVIFVLAYYPTGGAKMNMLYYLLVFTCFPCIILLFKAKLVVSICSSGIFTTMSSISYHTYMWHLTAIRFFYNLFYFNGIKVDTVGMMLLCTLLAILIGSTSFIISERARAYFSERHSAVAR